MRVPIFHISLHLPSTEWVTTGLIGEEIRIIGEFGLEVLSSSPISRILANLIVNLVLRACLFGKHWLRQWLQSRLMNQIRCFCTKGIIRDLLPFEAIWIAIWEILLTLSFKLIRVVFCKPMPSKLPLKLKESPSQIVMVHSIGNSMMLGLQFHGQASTT